MGRRIEVIKLTEEEFKKNAKTIPTNIEKEEKIALDYFKYKVLPTTNGTAFEGKEEHYTKVVLNLIEKLKKENEELNNRDTSRLSEIGQLRTKNNYLENEIKDNYIPKDKIRELFKELYMVEGKKFAKIKTIDSDKAFKFIKDIEKLLEEE